jgi:ankyrin repeat protein
LLLLLLLLLSQVYAKRAGPACSSLVQLLLQHGATAGNPNAAVRGLTPLHLLACWHPGAITFSTSTAAGSSSNSSTDAKKRVSKPDSSNLTATGEEGMSAADRAAVAEQIAAATLLLEQQSVEGGPDINVQWLPLQQTPLAVAATTGAYDFAAWLISKGADVNQPRKVDAARPIDLAVWYGHTKVACMLLEHGAEVSISGEWQQQQHAMPFRG